MSKSEFRRLMIQDPERVYEELAELRLRLAVAESVAEKAKAWLAAEDAFNRSMDEATTRTWHPNYADEIWAAFTRTREEFRKALEGREP